MNERHLGNLKIQWGYLLLLILHLSICVDCFDHTLKYDFPGPYCKKINQCCHDRQDDCSLPITNTLCYCDEFCDRTHHHVSDCCPDYNSFCKNAPDPIISCQHNGIYFNKFNTTRDNCNECRCLEGGHVVCDTDLCLTDDRLVTNVNTAHSLGWTAKLYDEWLGHKHSEGLIKRLGTKEPTFRVKAMSHMHSKSLNFPKSFNALEKWPHYISDITDQGWCGSSWVISTASVASDRYGIHSQGKEIVELSPQNILSCTRKQEGCNGGHLDAAWRYLHKHGVLTENCYPYVGQRNSCKIRHKGETLLMHNCEPSPGVNRKDLYTVGPAYSLNDEKNIMSEIFHSGPVQATMHVYRDFFSYSSGIYRHSTATLNDPIGFHSVKIIGWGEDHYSGTKYWIAANSWGPWWGENGYFRIVRGSNECGIEEYVLAAWPNVYNDFKTN